MPITQTAKRRLVTVVAAAATGLALTGGDALADPVRGANSTPGHLICGDETFTMTSGSDLANSLQLIDDQRVFVVQSIPVWDFYIAGGRPDDNLLTCVLDEPSIGYPIEVTGTLTRRRG